MSYPIPLGVVDPDAAVTYASGNRARIERIENDTGHVIATTDQPGHPIIASANSVVGWRSGGTPSSITIFLLETDDLNQIWERRVELPPWVEVDSVEHDDFSIEASLDESIVKIDWAARSRYSGGAAPPSDVESSATNDAHGSIELDLETGTIASERTTARAVERRLEDHPSGALLSVDGGLELIQATDAEAGVWRARSPSTGEDLGTIPIDGQVLAAVLLEDRVLAAVRDTQVRRLDCCQLPHGDRLWSHVVDEVPDQTAPPLPQ